MVRSTTFQPHARQHPDPIRIVAISVSIALNVALLAFLMRPPEFAMPAPETDTDHWVPVLPVHPKKLEEVKPAPDKPHTQTLRVKPQVIPRLQQPPVVNHDSTPVSIPVDSTPPTDMTEKHEISTQPVEASLVPIASPAPIYPRDALRDGITGTVELELLVGVDGSVLEVRITHSSGNRQLDNAAREQVLRNWRFQPAMRGGIAVQALGRVPIVFSLDGR